MVGTGDASIDSVYLIALFAPALLGILAGMSKRAGRRPETFDIDLEDLEPKCTVRVTAYRDGQKLEFDTLCRVDVPAEVEYIANGGILQYVLRRMAQ